MAFLLKELFLLTLVATVLTFPWQSLDTSTAVDEPLPNNEKEAYPVTNTKRDTSPAVDEPPRDHDKEVYPVTGGTKRDIPTAVDKPPPDHDKEVYPVTGGTKRDTSTAVDEPPPDHDKEVYPGTETKRASVSRVKRGVVSNGKYLWPEVRGSDGKITVTIYYKIADGVDVKAVKWIKDIADELSKETCICFERVNQDLTSYVEFRKGSGGCSSDIGYRKGKIQYVDLGNGCEYRGTIVHEMMHLLGFYHEHSRPDRNKYIIVNMENAIAGLEGQFKIRTDQNLMSFPYDFHSIMQYGEHAFARSEGKTMVEKHGETLGQDSHEDAMDLLKINRLYHCPNKNAKDHEISLKTGNGWGDGTDACVYLRLIGTEGKTHYKLITSGGKRYADENEQGSNEKHNMPFQDVGKILKAQLALRDCDNGPPPEKKKRSTKGAQRQWGQKKRSWLDGWTDEDIGVDGMHTNEEIELDPGDTSEEINLA